MTFDRSNMSRSADPLPDEFSHSLRELDERLSAHARQSSIPLGLATRVFEASRPMLATEPAQPRLRLVGTGTQSTRPMHRQWWARLAMAASFMLACVVAYEAMNGTPHDSRERLSSVASHAEHDSAVFTLQPSHVCAFCHYEDNLTYLFETNSMTSDDLTNEIAMLASRF